jgi:hypothetical protein
MIKARIEGLDFVDKIAGLVSVTYMKIDDVQKSFPVACDVTAEDCISGAYNDLCPNSKYRTVLYFEDGGVEFKSRSGIWTCFTSHLRLVCWINVGKYKADCCGDVLSCSASADIIKKIICALPAQPENIDPYSKFYPVVTSQVIRSNSIFANYSYNETQTQYLMSPYDYFSLNIATDFCICMEDCE